jgi:hypothetical protein
MDKSTFMTRLEMGFSVLVLTMIAAIVLPSLQAARLKAQQNTSRDKLKNLALGILNYHDVYGRIPTGGWVFDGKERYGWSTAVLPYVDKGRIFVDINHHVPWYHPDNQPHARISVEPYLIPGSKPVATDEGYALTHYAANASLMHRNSSLKLSQITNGKSNTVLMGETKSEFRPWAGSWNWRPLQAPLGGAETFGGPNSAETLFVLLDGQVKAISKDVDAAVLQKLGNSGYTPKPEDLVRPPIPDRYASEK